MNNNTINNIYSVHLLYCKLTIFIANQNQKGYLFLKQLGITHKDFINKELKDIYLSLTNFYESELIPSTFKESKNTFQNLENPKFFDIYKIKYQEILKEINKNQFTFTTDEDILKVGLSLKQTSSLVKILLFLNKDDNSIDFANIDSILKNISNISKEATLLNTETKDLSVLTEETKDEYAKLKDNISSYFIPTGYPQLDYYLLGGFKNNSLNIISARTGVGKSSIALNFINNSLSFLKQNNKYALMINYEMSETEIIQRLVSIRYGINNSLIMTGNLDSELESRYYQCLSQLNEENLKIVYNNDNKNLDSISYIIDKQNQILAKENNNSSIGIIYIDYLQLLRVNSTSFLRTHEQINIIMQECKLLATKHGIPIVLISQLNRDATKSPALENLKGSGSIEEHADLVLILTRNLNIDSYPTTKSDHYSFDTQDNTKTGIIIAKNRFGGLGSIELTFMPEYYRFDN